MKNENEPLATSDLNLAALALVRGLRLAWVDKSNPRRCVFHFDGNLPTGDLAAFATGDALVPVGPFTNAQRSLKRAVFAGGAS